MSIFKKKKIVLNNNTNTTTNENAIIDLSELLLYLSKCKGKLEVTFQKNENPEYESLCLVFIKIPIYGPVVSILEQMIEDEGDDAQPLSKGKIAVDKRDTNLYSLVGATRVKSVIKLSEVVKPVLSRMRFLLKEAIVISKSDNIGNIKNFNDKEDF